ncbi:hypothetical protein IWW49_004168, partial [Coemansia sp. RSA 1797]
HKARCRFVCLRQLQEYRGRPEGRRGQKDGELESSVQVHAASGTQASVLLLPPPPPPL